MIQQTKTCRRCGRENQLTAPSCYHCGSPFYEEDLDAIRDSLVSKARMRIIYCWIIIAIGFCGFAFIPPPAPWYRRLLLVLLSELMIGAWFGGMLYVQARAAAQTPEGDAFRGPMPPGRAAFWTCFAAAGVFCCEYWGNPDHLWPRAVGGALFCSSFIAFFAFILNWARGEQGKAWARKYCRQILAVYGLALIANVMIRLWDIYGHVTQRK